MCSTFREFLERERLLARRKVQREEKRPKEINKQNSERERAKQSLQKISGHDTVEFLLEGVPVASFSFKIDRL